jgi:hypothetical protein
MNTANASKMTYALETCYREGMNGFPAPGADGNHWVRMMLPPASMDATLVRLQYYRKSWGKTNHYRLVRVK